MKIRHIDRRSYDIRHAGQPLLHRDLAWYATGDDTVLGVVILDLVDHDFSWVVLTQNDQGPGYTAINLGISLPTEEAAMQALHIAMSNAHEEDRASIANAAGD